MPSVLIVDDDPPVRTMVAKLLGLNKYDVEAVGTGTDALQKLANKRYDAVVLDLMLPDVNGFEVLEYLDKSRVQCVVVISAGKEEAISEAVSHPSVRAALRKPFEVFELARLVAECVEAPATGTGSD